MRLLDLTPNRFHQCNWRDVQSTDFTSDNQIPADQYIEKLQMWSWKLMDLYHKTNKRSWGRTETFGEDGEQHNTVLSPTSAKRWNFLAVEIIFHDLLVRNQRLSPNKGSSPCRTPDTLSLCPEYLFWPSQFKFTDGSKSSGKYLVGQMTDWYWYYAPSHFSHKPLKFSSNISFVIKTYPGRLYK